MAATKSTSEIIADVLASFKVQFPLISRMSTNFSKETAKLNQTVIGRIRNLPTARDYDSSTGYKANAADQNDLVTDIPVLLDKHRHVPVNVSNLNALQTTGARDLYDEAVADLAYVLGKDMADSVLAKVSADTLSFSESVTDPEDADRATLGAITKKLNQNGAAARGRIGLVDSDIALALDSDPRITNREEHGQRREGDGYARFTNVAGFAEIAEYPDLATVSPGTRGVFCDPRAMVIATRVPFDVEAVREQAGIPAIGRMQPVTDPETGLTMLSIGWQDPGTFDVYITLALIWGSTVGKFNSDGVAGTRLDKAAVRLIATSDASA